VDRIYHFLGICCKESTVLPELRVKLAASDSVGANVNSAQVLLEKLQKPWTADFVRAERRLIEILVAGIRVDTLENGSVKQAEVIVTYRFSQPDDAMPVVHVGR
jgi:hypothetical protein